MSISLNANFELLSAGLYLDDRQQFNTIIEMKDFAETSIPDGFITYNKETQKHYVFSSSNTVDATLGKWREYNTGEGSSEKQIKDWVSGSSYLEGDYIYHEGELYRCLASNSDVDFDESNWEQITYGIDELSKEDVEGLLGLTEEELETMASLISDTEVRLDKTYSSSKIYTDIQQCLEDSKAFTITNVDDKVDKDKIVTTIDNTVTDEQVASALLTKTEFDKINESISTVNANLGELCNKKIYCSEATGTIVDGFISVRNPIGKVGNVIANMRYQSPNNPVGYAITTQVTPSSLNFYFRWHRESDNTDAYPPDGTKITVSYMIFY